VIERPADGMADDGDSPDLPGPVNHGDCELWSEIHRLVVPVELADERVGVFNADWFEGKGLRRDDTVDTIGQR
jgi:hypothetical protein